MHSPNLTLLVTSLEPETSPSPEHYKAPEARLQTAEIPASIAVYNPAILYMERKPEIVKSITSFPYIIKSL
jgi:hypothetical protein